MNVSPKIMAIAKQFKNADARLYFVGGWVRNSLIGKESKEIDVCSQLSTDEVLAVLSSIKGVKANVISKELGTVRIDIDGEEQFLEHTMLRTESYPQGGEHLPCEVKKVNSVSDDAKRRDFTVNTIYYDPITKETIDLYNGERDVKNGIVKMTTEHTLKDDALRILRMVRLACETGFMIDEHTFVSARENAYKLKDISMERRAAELSRILLSDIHMGGQTELSGPCAKRGLELLIALDAFKHLLPHLESGRGYIKKNKYHAYDVLRHNVYACMFTPPILHLRMAALLHDVGKPDAYERDGNFYDHALVGSRLAYEMLGQDGLKYPKALVDKVVLLIQNHMFDLDGRAKETTVRLRFAKLGLENAIDLLWIRRADVMGSRIGNKADFFVHKWGKIITDMQNDGTPLKDDDLHINGKEIMKACQINGGEMVGKIKDQLWKECILNPKLNEKTRLIQRAKRIKFEI